jgi:hypothetical protein
MNLHLLAGLATKMKPLTEPTLSVDDGVLPTRCARQYKYEHAGIAAGEEHKTPYFRESRDR